MKNEEEKKEKATEPEVTPTVADETPTVSEADEAVLREKLNAIVDRLVNERLRLILGDEKTILAIVFSNPNLLRAIAVERARRTRDASAGIPRFAPSGASCPATVHPKPENLGDATKEARMAFRV